MVSTRKTMIQGFIVRAWALTASPMSVFLIMGACSILAFAILSPAGTGPDEVNHIYRVAGIANGWILPHQYGEAEGMPLWGGEVPEQLHHALHTLPQAPDFTVTSAYHEAINAQEGTVPVNIPNTEVYSPVPYLPALLAYGLSWGCGFSVLTTIVLMRLFGGVAYLVLTALVIVLVRNRNMQWLIAVVALVPVGLFQASIVSADTLTNVVVVAFSSIAALDVFLKQRLVKSQLVVLLIAALALPLMKPTYVLLVPLLLLVKSIRIWLRVSVTAAALVLFAFWYKMTGTAGYGMGWMRVREDRYQVLPNEQLQGVIHDPLYFVNSVIRTFFMDGNDWFTQAFGQMGYFHDGTLAASAVTPIASLIALTLVANLFLPQKNLRLARWATSVIVLVSLGAIVGTLYLNFTVLGRNFVEGVQGRYLYPFFVLGIVLLATAIPAKLALPASGSAGGWQRFVDTRKSWRVWVIGSCAVSILSAVVTFIIRYRMGV